LRFAELLATSNVKESETDAELNMSSHTTLLPGSTNLASQETPAGLMARTESDVAAEPLSDDAVTITSSSFADTFA
jgi:hypothetical protein